MNRVVLTLLMAGVGVGALVGFVIKRSQPPTYKGQGIPDGGRLKYPQAANPGDPMNAVKDFKRMYWALNEYRKRHKKLPSPMELQDTSKELLPGVKLVPEDFENPDNVYRESEAEQEKLPPPYTLSFGSLPRPDIGSPALSNPPIDGWDRPVFSTKGEKYPWAHTTIYARSNARIFRNGRTTYHHTGFHIVLWSDGSIEKIPESKILLQPLSESSWRTFYPGDARVGKDAFPKSKQWEDMNSKAVTLGKEPHITWEDRQVEALVD